MAPLGPPTVDIGTLLKRTAVGVVLALVVNLSVLTLVRSLDLVGAYESLEYGPVTTFSSIGVVGAAVVYTLLDRATRDHNAQFTRIALVVLALSFVPNIILYQTDEAASLAIVSILMVMHVPPALGAILSLTGRLESVLA